MALLADAPPLAPETVMARAGGENFPVASRVLPRAMRGRLLALYGFARLADELGDVDERPGTERLAALDWLEGELDRAYAGRASHPLLVALTPVLQECALPRAPFVALIEANRTDQRVTRYETWEQLLGYCELSANPVGELVLGVFGKATPERRRMSGLICTALQLAEHWQDVAEDYERGRVYLPAEDLARFGCTEEQLRKGARADWPLRGLIAFEVARTRALLSEGLGLIDTLRGREKLAVAAFAGGAVAALEAVQRAHFDVFAGAPQASSARRLAATVRLLMERRR
jgi:squalene synthase HpnC